LSDQEAREPKTVIRSIRIPESLSRSIQKEADKEGTTFNARVSAILSRHFEWEVKAQEFGYISIPKAQFRLLLEEIGDEALVKFGREIVPGEWRETAEFWFGDSSTEAVLDYFKLRARNNSPHFTMKSEGGGGTVITVRHDFGPRWSIVLKSAFQEFVKQAYHVEPQVSSGESVVTVRFKVASQNQHYY